jgi:hypothetical protein
LIITFKLALPSMAYSFDDQSGAIRAFGPNAKCLKP